MQETRQPACLAQFCTAHKMAGPGTVYLVPVPGYRVPRLYNLLVSLTYELEYRGKK